jgi:CubicO group peptidase (beta-lactamase class C family)
VTRSSIQTLLNRRVIKPLHLRHTFFATSGRFRGAYAHGYIPPSLSGGGYVDVSGWSPSWGWAAGAVVSNAPDLARFYTALMSGRLLKPRLLRQMTTTVDTGQPGLRYGLGIFNLMYPCGQVWGHNGDIFGYSSFALTDPARQPQRHRAPAHPAGRRHRGRRDPSPRHRRMHDARPPGFNHRAATIRHHPRPSGDPLVLRSSVRSPEFLEGRAKKPNTGNASHIALDVIQHEEFAHPVFPDSAGLVQG